MDDLAVYANQWRIGMNAGKTSKLLFQRSTLCIPDWHTTRQGHPLCHRQVSWHQIRHHAVLHQSHPCCHQPCSSPPSQIPSLSTSTYGPSPSTTIRLFNIYIRTLLEYGSAATCVTKSDKHIILDLPNTLNHDILRRHADEPTIHDRLLYLAKCLRKQCSATLSTTLQEENDEYRTKY